MVFAVQMAVQGRQVVLQPGLIQHQCGGCQAGFSKGGVQSPEIGVMTVPAGFWSQPGQGAGGTQGGGAEQKPAALSNKGITVGHGYALPPAVSNRPAR